MNIWLRVFNIVLWALVGALIAWACLVMISDALGDQQYNPMSGEWETCPSDAVLKYSPVDKSWSYQPPKSQVEYNPHNQVWEWSSGLGNKKVSNVKYPNRPLGGSLH